MQHEYDDDFDEYEDEQDQDEDQWDGPSRSQLKRDAEALQKMGAELVKLNKQQLDGIEMPDELRRSINEAQRLTSHGGLRRQMQYIGKVMRHIDVEPIRLGLEKIRNKSLYEKAHLHKLEQWRDRLLAEGDAALGALLEQYPAADSQHLRQLIRQANHERKANKPPRAARELFRSLRELLDEE